ncbi:MAG: tripartite tricarboxylate transporter substrate binding protein [Proteobacteria bacterium]|nr:tripartite tricarboxylate transporter substrate binding protein [Burkholderiales bacterium]
MRPSLPSAHARRRSAPAVARTLAALAPVAALSLPVHAQDWPVKPVRIVVPFAPGGATDVVTRVFAQRFQESFAQPFVIENRGGAGGLLGAQAVSKAAPDGYTLVMGTTGTHAINATLYEKTGFDPLREFAPITRVALLPNMIIVHPSLPARTVKELIALARRQPGVLNYATAGNFLFMSGEVFRQQAGIEMTAIPFKGSGLAMSAVMSGDVALSVTTVGTALPHLRAGKLRAIAVTSARRMALVPDVPTVMESGLPGHETVAWYGLFAPAGTGTPILSRLATEVARLARLPEVRDALALQGAEAVSDTPGEFAAIVKADVARWGEVVRRTGVRAD